MINVNSIIAFAERNPDSDIAYELQTFSGRQIDNSNEAVARDAKPGDWLIRSPKLGSEKIVLNQGDIDWARKRVPGFNKVDTPNPPKTGIIDKIKNLPTGVKVGAGAALVVGGGAIAARKLYIKKRMKQTGASSVEELKQIIKQRRAEKKELLSSGTSKADVKEILKQKYGY